ncbi:MAG TPA: hypothetical protein VFQ57_01630, partial [Sphingomonas sp.]|nr:hypothetical protein [Sphingomonas sp.]
MTTPYDTALRVAQRKLDDVRAAIGAAVQVLDRIEQADDALAAAITREKTLSSDTPRIIADRYFAHARSQ